MPLLEEPADDQVVRPWTAINIAVAVYYDRTEAAGIDERYRFRVDGEEITLSSVRGGGRPHDEPDVVFASTARLWIDLRQGRLTLSEAMKQHLLRTTGSKTALADFQRIFHVA